MSKSSEEWLAEAIVTVIWRHAQHNYEGHMFIGSFAPVGVEGFSRHVRQEAKLLVPMMISEFKTIPYNENPVTGMKTIIDEEIVKELVFAQIHRMLIVFGAILEEDKPKGDVPEFAG